MARILAVLVLSCVSLGMLRPARACGAFFASETSQNLAIGAQRALLVVGAERLALHLQLAAATDGEAFAWVIPVPEGGGPPTVALGDQAIFDDLDRLTSPSVTIQQGSSDGGGLCAGDAGSVKGGDFGEPRGGIQHFGGADLGPYSYDVIAGSKPEEVAAWLADHGYLLPDGFAEAITAYAESNVFVAVRQDPGTAADGAVNRPLQLSWPRAFEAGLGYALGLSRLSASEVMPLLLWVLADKRQRVANFGSTDVAHLAEVMRDEGRDYPEAVSALTEAAGGRLVITEFAKDIRPLDDSVGLGSLSGLIGEDTFYLTRFYAEVPRAALEDLVITFAADAPDVEPHVTIAGREGGGLVIASSLLALLWLRRRA